MPTPDFLRLQRQFAARVRNPAAHAVPEDVPPSRMKVYEDLIRNNVERFIDGAFPKARKLLGDSRWSGLVDAFLERHGSESPYFRDIGEEFVAFLQSDAAPETPDFLLELCHYERVRTLLRRAEAPPVDEPIDPDGDLLAHPVAVSPLAWPLSYRYPVHQINAGSPADEVRPKPTWLIAWRRADGSVGVMASNALTHRLLELLRAGATGQQALDQLVQELPSASPNQMTEQGATILARLRDAGMLLGTQAHA